MSKKTIKACEDHGLPYLAFFDDAKRRHKRGERQVWCSLCRKWTWPAHVSDDHRPNTLTKRQFEQLVHPITLSPKPAKGGG